MSSATLSPPLVRGAPLGRAPVGRHGWTAPVPATVPVLELVATRPEAPLLAPAGGRARTRARTRSLERIPNAGRAPAVGRTPVRLTRRGRLTVTVTVLVMALAVGLLSLRAAAAGGAEASAAATSSTATTSTLTVARGDTLWAIAEQVDPHSDPRVVVERLRELNGLASTQLRAGEELVVPAG